MYVTDSHICRGNVRRVIGENSQSRPHRLSDVMWELMARGRTDATFGTHCCDNDDIESLLVGTQGMMRFFERCAQVRNNDPLGELFYHLSHHGDGGSGTLHWMNFDSSTQPPTTKARFKNDATFFAIRKNR